MNFFRNRFHACITGINTISATYEKQVFKYFEFLKQPKRIPTLNVDILHGLHRNFMASPCQIFFKVRQRIISFARMRLSMRSPNDNFGQTQSTRVEFAQALSGMLRG